MSIENSLDSRERLTSGVFFTSKNVVNEIIAHFDFTKINSIIDSAAGSCNFLISLAKKYPNKQFYGIEKNIKVFNATKIIVSKIRNLHYYHADLMFNKLNIPLCDLYLGNPPFINFTDLDNDYKEKIKPLWLKYFEINKGFKMLLGSSRGDIAQLIFYYTITNYLVTNGQIGVVLPNSLVKGNEASNGFREFNHIAVSKIVDISHRNAFENTNRSSFYIIAQKGKKTTYPIEYWLKNKKIDLIKVGNDLISNDSTLLGNCFYRPRQGINTLGANDIFFFKKEVPFKSQLIYPLYKSSDIIKWKANPSYHALLPYINKKILSEEKLQESFPQVYDYLLEHKTKLKNRKSRFITHCWYSLFGIGEYTFSTYKVIWKALGATRLEAAVISKGIPNQSMHCYIPFDERQEAFYVCGVMNSKIYNQALLKLNESGAKSFAQPSTIKKIAMPKFNIQNKNHLIISKLSEQLHNNYSVKNENELNEIVNEKLFTSQSPTG